MYNRAYAIRPKVSKAPELAIVRNRGERLFGQLTMIQYLHRTLDLSDATALPAHLAAFPDNPVVEFKVLGAPKEWQSHPLWKPASGELPGEPTT